MGRRLYGGLFLSMCEIMWIIHNSLNWFESLSFDGGQGGVLYSLVQGTEVYEENNLNAISQIQSRGIGLFNQAISRLVFGSRRYFFAPISDPPISSPIAGCEPGFRRQKLRFLVTVVGQMCQASACGVRGRAMTALGPTPTFAGRGNPETAELDINCL